MARNQQAASVGPSRPGCGSSQTGRPIDGAALLQELRDADDRYLHPKRGRRFRYYVCKAAQLNGYEICPTKSIAAGKIETSVVTQLQMAVTSETVRGQLCIRHDEWETSLNDNPTFQVRSMAKKVSYDGISGDVVLTLGAYECQPSA